MTIPQGSGVTGIGRASIPAKAVQIQIVDAQAADLSIQTSYLLTWGSPFDDAGYKRPLRPNSYPVKLLPQQDNAFISPFGGPLMLDYRNATAGSVITLKIKGSAKYAHYDFTQEMSSTVKEMRQLKCCKAKPLVGIPLNLSVVKFNKQCLCPQCNWQFKSRRIY